MSEKIVKILLRGDSEENWVSHNPILGEREPAVVIGGPNHGKIKIGDGITRWNDLPNATEYIFTAVTTEAQARQQGDTELAQALAAEAQARQQANRDLAGSIDALSTKANINTAKVNDALAQLGEYKVAVEYLIELLKSEHIEFGDIMLMTEDGDYLVTEDGDYLVAG